MVDVDVLKLLPDAFDDVQRTFMLPGILPGGSHCMMSAVSVSDILESSASHYILIFSFESLLVYCFKIRKVNASGRPFMGPNLYLTPPASFTHFHQDGHVRFIAG